MTLTSLEQCLGTAVIAIITGVVGHYLGGKRAVKENTCCERRLSCFTILTEKITALTKMVEELNDIVKNKILEYKSLFKK